MLTTQENRAGFTLRPPLLIEARWSIRSDPAGLTCRHGPAHWTAGSDHPKRGKLLAEGPGLMPSTESRAAAAGAPFCGAEAAADHRDRAPAERLSFRSGQIITKSASPGWGIPDCSGLATCVEKPQTLEAPDPLRPVPLIGEMAMLVEHEVWLHRRRAGPGLVPQDHARPLHTQMLKILSAEHLRSRIAERLRRVQEVCARSTAPCSLRSGAA